MGNGHDLAWWQLPDRVSDRWMPLGALVTFMPRLLLAFTGSVLAGAAVAVAAGLGNVDAELPPAAGTMLGIFLVGMRALRLGALMNASAPLGIVPRRPRSRREALMLAFGLVTGLFLRAAAIRLWSVPVVTYTEYRRQTIRQAVMCLLTGVPLLLLAPVFGPGLVTAGVSLSLFASAVALMDAKPAAIRTAEVALLLQYRHRVRFRRLLEDAVARQVLVCSGGTYRFRDPAVQASLATAYEQALAARARRIPDAVAAGTGGARRRLLAHLSQRSSLRVSVDLGCGVSIAVLAVLFADRWSTLGVGSTIATVLDSVFSGVITFVFVFLGLDGLPALIRWSLWRTSRVSRRGRLAAFAAGCAVLAAAVWLTGPGAVRHGLAVGAIAVMPAAMVSVVGGWLCVLAHRRWRAARSWPLRHVADALASAVTAMAVASLIDRTLVSAQASAGLLFPAAVWLSVLAWRKMNSARRLAVRAATDIAVSLMLGASGVLLLVWLANLLNMPPAEVAVVRDIAGQAGAVIDLPWWSWASLYIVLAAASVAFARWPGRLATATRWFARLRVVPSANAVQRSLTGVHIGLLVIVLVGLAAPGVTSAALRARLAARYTETLADNLRLRGELTAYQQIRAEFSGPAPPSAATLAAIVVAIHDVSKPGAGQRDATGTELDLARRIGQLQALTLRASLSPQAARHDAQETGRAEEASARLAGFDGPIRNAADLNDRAGTVGREQHEHDATAKLVDQAAELAAGAVSGTLNLVNLGGTEVLGIVREYLSGLVEGSPLTAVLAAWAAKLAGNPRPSDAVVPDAGKLEAAADAMLTGDLAGTPAANSIAAEQAMRRFLGETAIVAAVDMVNQVRYLQEGAGPCDGCVHPESPVHEPGVEDHPVEVP